MKKIAYLFSASAILALSMLSSCKKDEEPTPDENPDAPVVTATMNNNNPNGPGIVAEVLNVTTSTGTAKIRLDVIATVNLDRIYITRSNDNDASTPVLFTENITTSAGTFSVGSDYSFRIPSSTKNFILDIPVPVRSTSAAVTDVYEIWITDGVGGFTKPSKNLELGKAKVTLKYTAAAVTTFASGTITLGDQYNTTAGSLLVTGGQIAALETADYIDAPGSGDLCLGDLNGAGTARTTGGGTGNLYLFSPSERSNLNYQGCTTCTPPVGEPTGNVTYIALYSGTTTFANITGAELEALSVGTGKSVAVTNGATYMFQTSAGKKGLLKINSTTDGTAGAGNANVSIKVLQ